MIAPRSILIVAWVDVQEEKANFPSRVFLLNHALLHTSVIPDPQVLQEERSQHTSLVSMSLVEVLQLLFHPRVSSASVALPFSALLNF